MRTSTRIQDWEVRLREQDREESGRLEKGLNLIRSPARVNGSGSRRSEKVISDYGLRCVKRVRFVGDREERRMRKKDL